MEFMEHIEFVKSICRFNVLNLIMTNRLKLWVNLSQFTDKTIKNFIVVSLDYEIPITL